MVVSKNLSQCVVLTDQFPRAPANSDGTYDDAQLAFLTQDIYDSVVEDENHKDNRPKNDLICQ